MTCRFAAGKKPNFEVAKPEVAIYVLTEAVKGVAVAKPSAAALSKVAKPNVDRTYVGAIILYIPKCG